MSVAPAPPPSGPPTRPVPVVLVSLLLAVSLAEGGLLLARGPRAPEVAPPEPSATPPAAPAAGAGDLPAVVARAMRSVVAVRSERDLPTFFGGTERVTSQGSGVIVGRDLVVTNAHVVEGATAVAVSFADDGGEVPATVLGTDPAHDLAVLSADTAGRPAMPLGSSGGLALGEPVVALGYPLGLGPTATAGIVSGLNRSLDISRAPLAGAEHLEGLLQTDAAINPGNSGGPLIDAAGRLVGINTAGASAATAENIGFAIAIDDALPVIRRLAGGA